MQTVAVVVFGVGVVAVAVGVAAVVRLRGEVRRLGERAARTARRVEALPPDLSKVLGTEDRHVISVELLNLFELAHRETWVARPLSLLTPRLLRDAIHRRLVGRVRANLASSGVRADVRLHRVR
ncbi:MAG TPA: hypothetical protein VFV67_16160 [Actinophytocola sp.]|uniref:hypothetical protein n=1 Tax=Actinophytocola sp. TaxID=1872138 RepID=UPI002DBBBF13|nr:hypothetical protein [Actinophytocola sp.]HEU5472188.1 hypothetical protein [Actinophytocola sp.]